MSTYDENQHPRGADGKWTRRPPSPPATALTETRRRVLIARGGDLLVSQLLISYMMDAHGRDLGAGDDVEVRCPAYNAYLPDTPARVTVRGGLVCRTPDQSHGQFAVRDRARLIARGGAHAQVYAASSADVYDDAQADLHKGATGYLYGAAGVVRARAGSTVYAWTGTVHAQAGSTVWLMGPDVTLDAEDGARVGDGKDSPLERAVASTPDHDIFRDHRLSAEEGVYDPEPRYPGGWR
ncbi:MAG: hypothetical protein Q4C85_07330 [Actinomyces sp.]|uniref:hypothetical protein n=1 Tax=Actinomyces sp. TaxID=29317 RepID=UPI0026DB3489|nr:hypothetical protein [Actinomyces sp.]MDO4243555.1 hypothetical protein [Actinomyces sp.]